MPSILLSVKQAVHVRRVSAKYSLGFARLLDLRILQTGLPGSSKECVMRNRCVYLTDFRLPLYEFERALHVLPFMFRTTLLYT